MKISNKILVVVIVVIGLYAAFLIASDINTISSKLSDFKIEIIPVVLLLVTSGWFVLFFRWHLLLQNAKIFIPIKDSFLILTSGFALTIIPGKVGELVKSQLLKMAHQRYEETGKEQWEHSDKWEKYCPVCKAKKTIKQSIKI